MLPSKSFSQSVSNKATNLVYLYAVFPLLLIPSPFLHLPLNKSQSRAPGVQTVFTATKSAGWWWRVHNTLKENRVETHASKTVKAITNYDFSVWLASDRGRNSWLRQKRDTKGQMVSSCFFTKREEETLNCICSKPYWCRGWVSYIETKTVINIGQPSFMLFKAMAI